MDFDFTRDQLELRVAVREFAARSLADAAPGEGFRRDLWERMAEFGILGLPVPRAWGGSEQDVVSTTVAMEALGYGCPNHGLLFSVHAHLWAVTTPLLAFGTESQKQRYLPELCGGRLIGAHAMSEPDSGSDAFSLRTRAVRDGDGYVLDGVKTFVTNAPVADVFVVFATVNPSRRMWGVTAFVVDRQVPGLDVSAPFKKMGLTGSPMGEVVLRECRVPESARLGVEGQGAVIFNHSMGWERACILGSQVGRLERQLESALEYARDRRQFGRRIGDFQLVAARLADMRVRLETARLLLYRAAAAQAAGQDVGLYAAMAKLHISEVAVQSGLDAVQLRGGYGYMQEFAAEGELRDAIGGTLYSGTSEMQRLVIARALGLTPT